MWESRQAAAEAHHGLVEAIFFATRELAGVEAERLVSVSMPLSVEGAMPAVGFDGDSRWFGPHDGLRIYADGEVARFESDAAGRFDAECRRWHLLGADSTPPLAFFTVPPATAPAVPCLWVPRVTVRQDKGASVVTLNAWWTADSSERVAQAWLRDAGRIFAKVAAPDQAPPLQVLATEADPSPAVWDQRVRAASRAVADGRLAKVVLARRLALLLSRPADPARVGDELAGVNPECCVFSLPCGRGWVIAASPELLAVKRGSRLVSHAVAGTAGRHGGTDEDARAAAALMASAKERREHGVVVDAIASCLRDLCEALDPLPEPAVMSLRFLQHLWTPISGRLRPGIGLIDAVTRLHPTPAVLGSPPQAAIDWLRDTGERRDGLYTGVAGWIDRDGNGDAAVVLRSAYFEDRTAVLWAGAGIMADSDPRAEFAETEMKLASLMEVLNAL